MKLLVFSLLTLVLIGCSTTPPCENYRSPEEKNKCLERLERLREIRYDRR